MVLFGSNVNTFGRHDWLLVLACIDITQTSRWTSYRHGSSFSRIITYLDDAACHECQTFLTLQSDSTIVCVSSSSSLPHFDQIYSRPCKEQTSSYHHHLCTTKTLYAIFAQYVDTIHHVREQASHYLRMHDLWSTWDRG